MGSIINGPSGPGPRFFIGHFQRRIDHYTWLSCENDISEEVKSHRSNVISRLFVVPQTNFEQLIPLHLSYMQ